MSVITLQFGQCGNQIGQIFYNYINEDINSTNLKSSYCTSAINKWFHVNKNGKWEPRSVLIDAESKVIDDFKRLPFKFRNVVAKSWGGCANNWAFGYTNRSKLIRTDVLNIVRKEVEKCDLFSSFLNILSSSGGTGSGVGSSVIEQLRDEYPNKTIINAIVLPYSKGEIVTQNYNSLFALSKLYSIADSMILFENERLHHICNYNLNIKEVNFKDLNYLIAQQLAAVYQPLNVDISQIICHLNARQSFKFLQITSEPMMHRDNVKFEGPLNWRALIQSISKQSRFEFQQKFKFKRKIISNTLITRGGTACSDNDLKPLKDSNQYVPWLTMDEAFHSYHQPRAFNKLDKYLAVLSNNNSVCVPLNNILEDAWNLFTHGAYVHHYRNYGIDEDCFLSAFQAMENTLNDYKTLV